MSKVQKYLWIWTATGEVIVGHVGKNRVTMVFSADEIQSATPELREKYQAGEIVPIEGTMVWCDQKLEVRDESQIL